MSLKEKIENNPLIWLLISVSTGFAAGISAYQGILHIAELETVRKGSYVGMEEFRTLKNAIDTIKEKTAEVNCEDISVAHDVNVWEDYDDRFDFRVKLFNSTDNDLSCLIRVKSGFTETEEETKSWSEPQNSWTIKDVKDYSVIVKSRTLYVLKGSISQFPASVSDHRTLFCKVLNKTKVAE